MKKILLLLTFILAVLCFPAALHAQTSSIPCALTVSNQSGCIVDLRGSGITQVYFTWNTTGTVSAGACAVLGSLDNVTYGTTLIAAQTVTSTGSYGTLTSTGAQNYVKLSCTTAITGSGTVFARLSGTGPSVNSIGSFAWPSVCTTPATTNCGVIATYGNGVAIEPTDQAFIIPQAQASGASVSTLVTTGAAPATITSSPANVLGFWCDTGVGTGDTWCELFNAVSGNVTLGSTTVKLNAKSPGGTAPTGGGNSPTIPITGVNFSTALSWACTTASGGSSTAPSPCNLNIIWKQGLADPKHWLLLLIAMVSLVYLSQVWIRLKRS